MHKSNRLLPSASRPLAFAALSAAVAVALVAPGMAHASAFQLHENSTQGLGRAYAGSSTAGGDVSVVENNPAAMSDLDGTYVQADITAINFSAKFSGSSHDVLGNPISGGNGGDAGTTLPVPALAISTKVSDRVNLGVAFDVPYGFQTEYDNNWMGRYDAVKTVLKSYDSTLSASFKINDEWSIGASAIAERTNADLTNAINFNAVGLGIQQGIAKQAQAQAAAAVAAAAAQIQAAQAANQITAQQAAAMLAAAEQQATAAATAAATAGAAQVAAALPPDSDGYAEVKGNDWAWGWQLGAYWKPTGNDRLGLNYRSRITHDIDGTANFDTAGAPGYSLLQANPQLASSIPPFTHTSGTARLTNPAVATLSYWHQESKFGIGADVSWTQWSVMRSLTVDYANAQPPTVLPFNWRNTYYVAVGGEYYATDKLTLRAGVSVDQAPMTASNRDPRVPDAARRMAAFGIGYKASEHFQINASYAHIFVSHAGVNDATSATGDVLTGTYDDYGNLLSVSAQYKF
ncbi:MULTISPECIES: OmpP1/FadL family transporter [Rhodanobacter]|uniref:Outer membrane protein transport protein n=1 Tax=Rhodanobacter hydrolyticus TaxID=2250595 RepID=A0ABW8J7Q3_9GAMM|nr:outer membrane protein transport protein [Rhodanobacter sp. 7MK24]MBD8879907.1 outer membrane protein transport protein [Rhodanobacter sp. 7MK24]